jgi:hypothetical protein
MLENLSVCLISVLEKGLLCLDLKRIIDVIESEKCFQWRPHLKVLSVGSTYIYIYIYIFGKLFEKCVLVFLFVLVFLKSKNSEKYFET